MVDRRQHPIEYEVSDWKARASIARREAQTLLTRAEIWEEAAGRLEDAISAAKKPISNSEGQHQ